MQKRTSVWLVMLNGRCATERGPRTAFQRREKMRARFFAVKFALALQFLPVAAQLAFAQPQDVLPPIQHGTIAISLQAVATGMSAPDYGINPPGDSSRLFVL